MGPRREARQGKAWDLPWDRGRRGHGGMGREPTGEGPACRVAPAVQTWGPTWGGVWAHSVHGVVQRRQPALHVADALGEAGLLALQHLLQLADGREELLFVETVLGGERVTTATTVAPSVPHAGSQLPEAPRCPRGSVSRLTRRPDIWR